jgi:hypothetical protein
MKLLTAILALTGVALPANVAFAQADLLPEKSTTIARVKEAPFLDGILNDAIWSEAVVVDDFHEVRPTEYSEPAQRTEFLLAYDDEHLYIGARIFEEDSGQITAKMLRQGGQLRTDDRIGIILDPFMNKRSGFWFMTNPNSVRRDAIFKGEEGDWNWDGIWQVESALTDFGWSAEFAIPFKTLSFNEDSDWGVNFVREIMRSKEQLSWSSRNRQTGPSVAGTMTGIQGVNQGMGLDIVPSLSIQSISDKVTGEDDTNTEPSLDLYYKITPSLNASLTFNTDFSATEVDNRQVDLTRFSQFFPEKRSFFLRESEIFEFGGIGGGGNNGGNRALSRAGRENARPFFSRRIGLSEEGDQVGLDVGARMTGRVGIWNLGVLGIVQEKFEDVDATNIFVGRLAANVLEESTAGFIFTSGDPQSNLDNRLFGVDFNYRNSRLAGGKRLDADIWYQQSDTQGSSGDDAAYGIAVSYPSETGLRGGVAYSEIQENFNPALGFVSRSDIRKFASDVGYTHRFTDKYIDNIAFRVDVARIDFIDGGLQTQNIVLRPLQIQNWKGDEVEISHRIRKENLLEEYEVTDGIFIPTGEYEFADTSISLETSNGRAADIEIELRAGDFYTGNIESAEVELAWRPSRHFTGKFSYGVDFVDLPQGKFDRRVTSADLEIVLSNKLSWVNLIQFDNESNDLGIDSRLHWVPESGRNFYVVLSHNMNRNEIDDRFSTTQTGLTMKLDYTFRF